MGTGMPAVLLVAPGQGTASDDRYPAPIGDKLIAIVPVLGCWEQRRITV